MPVWTSRAPGEIRDVPLYRAMAPVNVRRGSGVLRADRPHEEESNEPDTPGDAGETAGGLVSRHSRRGRPHLEVLPSRLWVVYLFPHAVSGPAEGRGHLVSGFYLSARAWITGKIDR